jgi:hypothetical protein
MDLGSIFGLNSRFGAVLERIRAHCVLRSLTFADSLFIKEYWAAASRTFLKTALRLCRSEVIVALAEFRVCDRGHWLGVMKKSPYTRAETWAISAGQP